jgi:hypothetical protein
MSAGSARTLRSGALVLLLAVGAGVQAQGMRPAREDPSVEPKQESELGLPAMPQTANLQALDVPSMPSMRFSVDAQSVSVEPNGEIRYTLVARGAGSTTNTSYEGLRCAAFERRIYAIESGGRWQPQRGQLAEWHGLRTVSAPGSVAMALQMACDGRSPRPLHDIRRRLRDGGERLPP